MYGFAHDFCAAHPHDAGVEHRGDEDAAQEQQPQASDASGEPPCSAEHKEGEAEERHRVLQGFREGEARQSPCPPLPYQQPGYVERDEVDDHRQQSVGVEQQQSGPDGQALCNGAPHVDAASAPADGQVAVEGRDGDEGSVDAEQGEEHTALAPLLASGQQDELLRYQPQAEHGGEADEADEAQHLAEHLAVASRLVCHLSQCGLCHARHHRVYRAGGHVAPFACRGIDAGGVVAEELAQQDGEGVQVADVHNVGEHQLAAESEHLPCGGKGPWCCRPPRREVPGRQLRDEDEADGLRHDGPMGKALHGHRHADDAGDEHGGERADACLPHHQVTEEVGALHRAESGEQEAEEEHPRKRRQVAVPVEVGNQGRTEPEDGVERKADQDVEPEDGVVLLVGRLFPVAEGCNEAALLQGTGQGCKDVQHRHLALVRRRQVTQQDQPEHGAHQLHKAVGHPAPEYAFRCPFFQRILFHCPAKVTKEREKGQLHLSFSGYK